MAITSLLPVSEWYFEDTSEWTLDYPPLFAWFEYLLSRFAPAEMLVITKDPLQVTEAMVLFHRLTVMMSDVVLFYGIHRYCLTWPDVHTSELKYSEEKVATVGLLAMMNPGLLIVDHMHFQYNGMLLGMLLLSISLIRGGNDLAGGAMFAVIILFKHIFVYVAPLYFVYLLKHYCFVPKEEVHAESNHETSSNASSSGYEVGGKILIFANLS